jgi:hypothetical protein
MAGASDKAEKMYKKIHLINTATCAVANDLERSGPFFLMDAPCSTALGIFDP